MIYIKRMDKEKLLRNIPVFRGLPDNQIKILAHSAIDRTYENGQMVLMEEEHSRGLYLLLSGRVKIFKSSYEGREQTLYIFGAGETFCLGNALAGDLAPANAMTLDKTRILLFPGELLEELGRKEPALLVNLIMAMSKRLKDSMNMIESLALKEIPQRLASFLLHSTPVADSNTVELSITHRELSKILGTTPESLSRAFKKLSQDGIILIENRTIRILDREELEDLATLY